jgi:hypothetical protein
MPPPVPPRPDIPPPIVGSLPLPPLCLGLDLDLDLDAAFRAGARRTGAGAGGGGINAGPAGPPICRLIGFFAFLVAILFLLSEAAFGLAGYIVQVLRGNRF